MRYARHRIRIADDAFCVSSQSMTALAAAPQVEGVVLGDGLHARRTFAVLRIAGAIHYADTITGSIFDEHGEHPTDQRLMVAGLPAPGTVAPSSATEVRP